MKTTGSLVRFTGALFVVGMGLSIAFTPGGIVAGSLLVTAGVALAFNGK